MRRIWIVALGAAALVSLEGPASAFTHHPSTPVERAQTKALNDQQLALAKQENVGLAINAPTAASGNLGPGPVLPVAVEAEAVNSEP